MKAIIFFGTWALLSSTIGCTKAGAQKLGKKQQYALFENPAEVGSPESEKSCDDLGQGWVPSEYEEWTKFDPIETPKLDVPLYAGSEGDAGLVVYDPNTKKVRAAKDKEKVAVLCHYNENLAKTLNEADAAAKQKEELTAKRPKGNWQKFTQIKSNDEFAILGVGTREEALKACGLDYLPSITDKYRGDVFMELSYRHASKLRASFEEKDTFKGQNLRTALGNAEESLIIRQNGTQYWTYAGTAWEGSTTPLLICPNDRARNLETRAYIICVSREK